MLRYIGVQAPQRVGEDEGGIQLLSDIDDTLYSSGRAYFGTQIAGIDIRLPAKTLYPCVIAIHRSIFRRYGRHPSVFVSANPTSSRRKADHLAGLLGIPRVTIYRGDWGSFGAIVGRFSTDRTWYNRISTRKIENILWHIARYPSRKYFWVGDNGQGDEAVATFLVRHRLIAGAFIHLVDLTTQKFTPFTNVHYFCTYSDVAKILRQVYGLNVSCPSTAVYTYAKGCQETMLGNKCPENFRGGSRKKKSKSADMAKKRKKGDMPKKKKKKKRGPPKSP